MVTVLPLSVVKEKPGSEVSEHVRKPGHGLTGDSLKQGVGGGTLRLPVCLHGHSEGPQSLGKPQVRSEGRDSCVRKKRGAGNSLRWKHQGTRLPLRVRGHSARGLVRV